MNRLFATLSSIAAALLTTVLAFGGAVTGWGLGAFGSSCPSALPSAPISSSFDGGTYTTPQWFVINDGDSITSISSHTNGGTMIEPATATYTQVAQPFLGLNVEVINIALPGEPCVGMLANEPYAVAPLVVPGRTVVTLLCGANDIIDGASAATTWGYMQSYAANVHSYGAKICAFTTPTVGAPIPAAHPQLAVLNAMISANAGNTFDCVADFASGYNSNWTMDQLHPNPDGFAHCANIYWPTMLGEFRAMCATQ